MDGFIGFPREMPRFLFELKLNNTIDKQQDNLLRYRQLISEPLKLLYGELLDTVYDIDVTLETRPARCISTPYTDRRFLHDVPLKEYMYIRFKQAGKENNVAGLYFDMGEDFYSYGLRVYKQNASGMNLLRDKLFAAPEHYSEELDKLAALGFKIIGENCKKDRCPLMPDCSAKVLYNKRDFYIGKDVPINEKVFSHALSEEISEGFIQLKTIMTML